MFTIDLDSSSKRTLYQQVYDFIKTEIMNGNLKYKDKLPSKRNLAKNLGISILTVETAYNQLGSEGFIYTEPKKGFFVEDIKSISNILVVKPVVTNENIMEEIAQKSSEINLSSNQTEPQSFPFSVWAKLLREVLSSRQSEVMQNSHAQGVVELRQAIAHHLRDFRGMSVLPQQIVVGAGTEYLYGLLIQLLGFDKTYAVEDPCYSKTTRIYTSYGVRNVQIPMDKNGILIDELKSQEADVVHISPSHHFPTGTIMPVSRRYELLGWANENSSRYLIEDDYDSEFRFTGKPLPTLQSIDVAGKVIYMNTFTKTLSSTVRISYMVLPLPLLDLYRQRLGFYSCTVPVIDQYTLASFISEGYFEKHINRMRKIYSVKRQLYIDSIKKYDKQGDFAIQEADSGLHFLLRVKEDKLEAFLKNLERQKISLSCVESYYKNPQKKDLNAFVINYSAVPLEKIEEYVKRFMDFETA